MSYLRSTVTITMLLLGMAIGTAEALEPMAAVSLSDTRHDHRLKSWNYHRVARRRADLACTGSRIDPFSTGMRAIIDPQTKC